VRTARRNQKHTREVHISSAEARNRTREKAILLAEEGEKKERSILVGSCVALQIKAMKQAQQRTLVSFSDLEVALFPREPLGFTPVVGCGFAPQVRSRQAFRSHELADLDWPERERRGVRKWVSKSVSLGQKDDEVSQA